MINKEKIEQYLQLQDEIYIKAIEVAKCRCTCFGESLDEYTKKQIIIHNPLNIYSRFEIDIQNNYVSLYIDDEYYVSFETEFLFLSYQKLCEHYDNERLKYLQRLDEQYKYQEKERYENRRKTYLELKKEFE